jgi:predicted N-acyltransferase
LIFDYVQPSEIHLPGFINMDMSEPGTALSVNWASFDEYVQQLGKSARKDYNRHRNRANDLGIQINTHRNVNRLDEAITLILNVERHHQAPPNPRTRAALENAHLVDVTWITAEFDGRLVGCGALVGDGDTRALAYLGMDYDVQYAYFQLMYAAIRGAIESGVRVLWGGTAAYEFKERLGFERMKNTQIVFTASNRLVGRALRYLVAS